MKWSYKTVHFEQKKEGLLGGAFLDEAEIEEQLNEYGRSGWELVSVIEVQDGIIAFFKQSLKLNLTRVAAAQDDSESKHADADDADEQPFEPVSPHLPYTALRYEPEPDIEAGDDDIDHHDETSADWNMVDEAPSTAVEQRLSDENKEAEYHDRYRDQVDDEPEPDPQYPTIGAIKIE